MNPLSAELNPICHLLALLGAHLILHVSRIRVNSKQFLLVYYHSQCFCISRFIQLCLGNHSELDIPHP
jgi:hypothetical protein